MPTGICVGVVPKRQLTNVARTMSNMLCNPPSGPSVRARGLTWPEFGRTKLTFCPAQTWSAFAKCFVEFGPTFDKFRLKHGQHLFPATTQSGRHRPKFGRSHSNFGHHRPRFWLTSTQIWPSLPMCDQVQSNLGRFRRRFGRTQAEFGRRGRAPSTRNTPILSKHDRIFSNSKTSARAACYGGAKAGCPCTLRAHRHLLMSTCPASATLSHTHIFQRPCAAAHQKVPCSARKHFPRGHRSMEWRQMCVRENLRIRISPKHVLHLFPYLAKFPGIRSSDLGDGQAQGCHNENRDVAPRWQE